MVVFSSIESEQLYLSLPSFLKEGISTKPIEPASCNLGWAVKKGGSHIIVFWCLVSSLQN